MLHLNQFHCFYEQQQKQDGQDVLCSPFHQAAELCRSSLRAGTASLQQTPGPLTLTDLPVSSLNLYVTHTHTHTQYICTDHSATSYILVS